MDWMYQSMQPHYYDMMEPFWAMSLFSLLPLLLIWSLLWKGWALWLAARRRELPWFIALLLINTVGILEIFYIFVIAKRSDEPVVKDVKAKESTEATTGSATPHP